MAKQAFEVQGDFQMGRIRQSFKLQIVANNEEDVRERTYTELGSRHGVKRREVRFKDIRVLGADDLDPITQHRLKE